MFQLVAFDMDGTLADTMPLCIKAFFNSVSPYADHELSNEEILQTFGLNEIGMIKSIVGENYSQALEDFYFHYELLHQEVTEVFPGIPHLLSFLKKRKIPIALITGKGEKSCAITLKKLNLTNLFDEILLGSETSPNKKENIEYLLKKYAVSKEKFCYIGDTVQDIKACRDAGVVCLSAAWQESSDSVRLEKENPHHVYYSVNDLYKYICHTIPHHFPHGLYR